MATKLTATERYRRADIHLATMRQYIAEIDSGALTPRQRGSTTVKARSQYIRLHGLIASLTRQRSLSTAERQAAEAYVEAAHAELSACWRRWHK